MSKVIAVLGANGMLGSEVCNQLSQHNEYSCVRLTRKDVDIVNEFQVVKLYTLYKPQLVINCTGAIPIKVGNRTSEMIAVNAVGPHILYEAQGFDEIPIIHISTDCVFNGHTDHRRNWTERPDAIDWYGRSKALGEIIDTSRVVVVRTSFIGRVHGLVKWFKDSQGSAVHGWTHAEWTGSTVYEVAKAIVGMVDDPPFGVQHLATDRSISKYRLLQLIKEHLQLNVTIIADNSVTTDHRLKPTIELPKIEDAICTL